MVGRVVEGEGLFGKNDTIWAELMLDKDYKLTLDINYNNLVIDKENQQVKTLFGLYFPFNLVQYSNYKLNIADGLSVEEESRYLFILPKKMRDEQLFAIPMEGNRGFIDG